ncbi:MAG: cytochrome c oxidase subunit II [Pirellulaceae bacterium]|nr:cytochrome c oxidase subunit II [Pirellulaceae bacterium]
MNRFWSILFFLVPILGVGVCFLSAFDIAPFQNTWLPADISESGKDIDQAFVVVMWIVGIVFLGTGLILGFSLWAHSFSIDRKAEYSHGNTKLEIAWSIIPGIILIAIFVYQSFYWEKQKIYNPLELQSDGDVTQVQPLVRVVARKFGWSFRYAGVDATLDTADDFILENELYLPVDRSIVLELESEDVLHSFYLRNLRVKQDIIPGKRQLVWFSIISSKVEQGKIYDILCAELCGWGHSRMNGRLYPLAEEKYQVFLAEQNALQNQVTMGGGNTP